VSDILEVKRLVEQQNEAWGEFMKKNDARLKAIEEKGAAPADLVEDVKKLNDELSQTRKDLIEVEKKSNRPGAGAADPAAAERKDAMNLYMRKGDASALVAIQSKAMQSGSDPDGGYLVIEEIDREIDRVVSVVSAMSRICRNVMIGTNRYLKNVKTSGMAMRRVADGATGGETTPPAYKRMEIEVFPAEVEPWVFNETLEDAIVDLASDLAEEAAISFAEGSGSEFCVGNGVGKARGITAYTNVANASYAWGSVGYTASGASGAFAASNPADKLIDLQHALKPAYRPGANWLMSDATLAVARQFKDSSGAFYMWQPDTTAGFGGRMLGSPVEVDDNMPAIAANSYSISFANFRRAYTIVNRSGTSLIRDNITAKGTTKFNFRRRFGGGITNFEAIKLMKFATS